MHGVRETDHAIEFLTVDPTCTLPWMPYMAGELLPDGIIRGGRLSDGSATYAIKMISDDGSASFGYYNAESQQGYHLFHSMNTTFQLESLVSLWANRFNEFRESHLHHSIDSLNGGGIKST